TITHCPSPCFPLPSTCPVTYSLLTYSLLTYSLLHAYSISNHYHSLLTCSLLTYSLLHAYSISNHNLQYLHSPTTDFFYCTSRYVPPSPISIAISSFPSY